MKRIITILVAVVMALSTVSLGLAEEAPLSYESLGLTFEFEDVIKQSPNIPVLSERGIISRDPFISVLGLSYFALEKEVMAELEEGYDGFSDEERNKISTMIDDISTQLAYIIVTDAKDPAAEVRGLFEEDADKMEIQEFGSLDAYHYFVALSPTDDLMSKYDEWAKAEDVSAEILEEKARVSGDIESIRSALLERLKAASLSTPVDKSAAMIGQTLSFETTDLDGNTVKSEDLFKDNKITMVNVWGTWCINCTSEMAELSKIHTRLREKGCGIVGVESEQKAIEAVADQARAIMAENGTNYPNVIVPNDNPIFNMVSGYPTSIFVDSEGKILTAPIEGAAVNEYEATVDKLLAGENVNQTPDVDAAKNEAGEYRVVVYDQKGQPVEGAVIQLCDDVSCAFQKTDANGTATFADKEQKVYDIHVLAVPEGYAEDTNAYKTLDTFSDVNIFLVAK